jgi:hypothetical protein
MAADRSTAELECFLAERADHLLRTAALLAGSREAGEDLLQTATGGRAAAAPVAVVAPGGRDGGPGPAVDAAYVVQRADSALSAAGPGAIAQMTVTTTAIPARPTPPSAPER